MRKFSRRDFDFFLFYLLFHLISKEDASYGDLLALFFLAPIYHLEAFTCTMSKSFHKKMNEMIRTVITVRNANVNDYWNK